MLFLKILVYFIFLSLVDVVVLLQINLDLTEWVSESENTIALRHDCLHVTAWNGNEDNLYKIISYCLSELPSKWTIQKNNLDKIFTFDELSKRNITSHQLYLWSAPMDIVENYQFYLDQPPTSNEKSMALYRYYNCTLPRFGPLCQYSFDNHGLYDSSLTSIILELFQNNLDQKRNQTCYTLVECNTGFSSICIDWWNICDGIIQCIDGIDEEHCWQLEINKCKKDEYQCENGQCIPMKFYDDNTHIPDCLDGSDESKLTLNLADRVKGEFTYEDYRCYASTIFSSEKPGNSKEICGDTYVSVFSKLMYLEKPDTMSDICWLTINCYFGFPNPLISNCDRVCYKKTCKKIIVKECPDIFYMPGAPVAFGHIYIAYTTKYIHEQHDYSAEPEYICYNDQLCGGFYPNKTTISFNKSTCRRPHDFPLEFPFFIPSNQWFRKYIVPIHKQLSRCNTILRHNANFCNGSTMYQCVNSSKCISKIRLFDNKVDCDYGDDEFQMSANGNCPTETAETHIECTAQKRCLSRKLAPNNICPCDDDHPGLICSYVDLKDSFIKEHISFPTICTKFTYLRSMLINGQNETDETQCEQWPCNNTYTRCDDIWHCWNGADEVDCHPPSLLTCPLHHHVCISPETKKYMCLAINKAGDGIIDCLGASDERQLCRKWFDDLATQNFHCDAVDGSTCLFRDSLCNGLFECKRGDDEQFCNNTLNSRFSYNCQTYASILSDVDKFLCNLFTAETEERSIYFSLGEVRKSRDDITNRNTNKALARLSTNVNTPYAQDYCHRSIHLRVWLDTKSGLSTITCLCSPNYYGDRCQYQNQRVSLSIQFRAFSDSWQTPFIIVVMLIDDSDERTIHSHEQVDYLSTQRKNCKTKFNIVLLYSTRAKNQSREYSIHMDIYEKLTLSHRGSLLFPIRFPFLPVERIAVQLDIPHTDDDFKSCSDHRCVHGQCVRYFNHPTNTTFCKCNDGWSGRYCTIRHICKCSSDSLCLGILANNRSICICPIKKWGSRCLLHEQICQSNSTCHNDGQCIPIGRSDVLDTKFICICPQRFFGERCEIPSNELILSFEKDMILPQWMFVHFIEVKDNAPPEDGTTFKTISVNRSPVTIYWSRPYHIAFVEFYPNKYYLVVVQNIYNQSMKIKKTLVPFDRCPNIREVFNESFAEIHLIRRIKYYHLPCQRHSSQLSCFYDDVQLCFCYDFDHQRLANCFEFNHTLKHNCRDQSNCRNGAQCLQDSVNCPETSMCICPQCFYGTRCQFSSSGFGLSLDGILGAYIQPHVSITDQPLIVQISLTLTVLISVLGILNAILSMMTFMNKEPKKTSCGFYLIGSSITSMVTIVIFSIKFWILLAAQTTYMTNWSFLYFQCRSIDFLLRIGVNMDQWLNACVAIERAITALKGIQFNKNRSIKIAKCIIPILFCLIIGTNIHEILYRNLIDDDSNDEKRIWCIFTYSESVKVFNLTINILHFCIPFIINLSSALIIIVKTTRMRKNAKAQPNDQTVLSQQFQQHKHLIIAPLTLVILAIPRLIISFVSGCMTSTADSWLFLIGYFISYIPLMLTFIIFVLPSKVYKKEFLNTLKRYQRSIRARFHCFR